MSAGEFMLIDTCFKGQGGSSNDFTGLGIGDDASIHRPKSGMELVVSTDTSVEGVHWPENFPLDKAADRAVCAALSDLAAMGAEPLCAWLNVTARDSGAVQEMGLGATRALQRYDVELTGGDTCRSPVNTLSATVAGQLPEGTAMRRDQAGTSDSVWLVGRLGFHALGLQQWIAGNHEGSFVPYFDELKPQLQAGVRLRELGVKCCIDVSDGLLQDAGHLAKASRIGMDFEITSVPEWHLLSSKTEEKSALQAVAHGGEDYALLFTTPAQMQLPDGLAVKIGLCHGGSGVRLLKSGQPITVEKAGFDHFA
jgi:thiamine-monophosphate kinase